MTRNGFISLFFDEVVQPLLAGGFRFVGKGQTLATERGDVTLVLIRLGGRLAWAGSIAHILCARHRFLRALEGEAVPQGDTLEVNDYPYKFCPSSLFGVPPTAWEYAPSNLGHWDYDRVDYGSEAPDRIAAYLRNLRDLLLGPAAVWADALDPEKTLGELRTRGEDAWCERLWIEDLIQHVGVAAAGEQTGVHPESRRDE